MNDFVVLLMLLLLSAFFSAAETAFTSLSPLQLQEVIRKKARRGKLVKKLTEKPDILLATLLVGNNIVNLGASAMATDITIRLFGSRAIGISTGILTLIILIFSELTPKRLAIIYNDFITANTAPFILALSYILRPIIWFVVQASSLITRFFAAKPKHKVSLEGILHLLNVARDAGVVKDYEDRMVKSVFRFNDTPVEAIMTHRTEVFSLEANQRLKDVLETVNEEGYSRIPVYEDHPEKIVGIVLVKDIMDRIIKGQEGLKLKEIMIKPLIVMETRKVNELFWQFKRAKLNIAIVMDEYGGLAGVVTQEDVVEELFGELYDEDEEKGWEKITALSEGCYKIMGDTPLHTVKDLLGLDLPHGKSIQTIAGYVIERLDRFPQDKETLEIPEGRLIVESVQRNKIKSLRYIPSKGEGPPAPLEYV